MVLFIVWCSLLIALIATVHYLLYSKRKKYLNRETGNTPIIEFDCGYYWSMGLGRISRPYAHLRAYKDFIAISSRFKIIELESIVGVSQFRDSTNNYKIYFNGGSDKIRISSKFGHHILVKTYGSLN